MNEDWLRLQNIETSLSELLHNGDASREDKEYALTFVNKLQNRQVYNMFTSHDSLFVFRCSYVLNSILSKGLGVLLREQNNESSLQSKEIFQSQLESLFSVLESVDLFRIVEPVFLYQICRFYSRFIDDVQRLLQEHPIKDTPQLAVLVSRVEKLIWRQQDMLVFPDWKRLTIVPYLFAAFLILCRKWLSFVLFVFPQYYFKHSFGNIPFLVVSANMHPVFYVRQRSWELLLELQKVDVQFSRVILEESCREEVLSSLATLFSEKEINDFDSYFGYQADCVPNISTKKMFLRYYILGIVSSFANLSSNEVCSPPPTNFYSIERVQIILKRLASLLTVWYHPSNYSSLEYYLVMLFTEQDDLMCLLFMQVLKLHQSSLYCREQQEGETRMFALDIHSMVFSWLHQIDFDEQVILDFIHSSETEFLTFFMNYLNVILQTKSEHFICEIGDSSRFVLLLENLCSILKRLEAKNLIMFRCSPLVRKIRLVLQHIHSI